MPKANAQWTQNGNDGIPPINVFDLDSFLLTFNSYGIQKSTNNGISWYLIPSPSVFNKELLNSNGRIIVTSDKGIYISDD